MCTAYIRGHFLKTAVYEHIRQTFRYTIFHYYAPIPFGRTVPVYLRLPEVQTGGRA